MEYDTYWFKYCLCQGDTIESLISSAEGYQMLAKNIPLFNEVNALPIPMDILKSDIGECLLHREH
jgi:predicted RNase H-like HicB family nuclease